MSESTFNSCWFLTGPTASGKSAVGVELALKLDAEIVSMDSMALYKRMDIGTAKPTEEEQRKVKHHLVDAIEPWEEFSLAQYVAAAEKCAAEISGRNKKVLFVGGTPLYLKGLLRGIFEGPPAEVEFRRKMGEEAERHGPDWLHEELKKVDPAAAGRLHPNDARRLIRALEVHHLTGTPISELQRQFNVGRKAEECKVFVLDWPRETLCGRIDRRVEEMFERGLVEEVRGLVGQVSNLSENVGQVSNLSIIEKKSGSEGLASHSPHPRPLSQRARGESKASDAGASGNCVPTLERGNEGEGQVGNLSHNRQVRNLSHLSKTAAQGVGYREVIEFLEGRHSLEETIELVKTHTRQLAKRQSTWFRSLSECRFVSMSGEVEPREIAQKIER